MQTEETMATITCEQASRLEGRRVMVAAHPGDGKTETAVRHAAKLLGEGTEPAALLVVTATDEAAAAFSRRLASEGCDIGTVRIRSVFSLAAELACDAASASGAPAAIATSAQRSFLSADAMTALRCVSDDAPSASASDTAARAARMARAYGLIMADEVYECALEALDGGFAAAWAQDIGCVIADDWDLYSPDARRLCEKLGRRLFAVGAPGASFVSEGECVRAFLATRQDDSLRIRTFARCIDGADCAPHDNALRAHAIAPDDKSVRIVKWRTARAELEGAASLVKMLLARHPGLAPSDVCVVVPNAAWAKAVRESLHAHLLESTESVAFDPLAADPRKASSSGALASYVRLNLLAHPDCPLSWRMWAGIGQRGLAARAWLEFSQWCEAEGLEFESARQRLCSDRKAAFEGAEELRASFARAQDFVQQASGLRGFSLLSCVCPDGDAAFMRMAQGIAEREDAARLCDRVSANARFQRFDDAAGAVRICSASHMAGLGFSAVVVLGAVDGLVPAVRNGASPDAAIAEADRQRAFFASACAKARCELVVSLFQKAPEQTASAFGMRIMRMKMEGGQRFAMVRPSPFIACAGNAAPGAESAEQFTAIR